MIRNLDSFSRLKQQDSGSLPIEGMERLADLVLSPEGDVHYVASGRIVTGADGTVLRKLLLRVKGSLLLPGESPDSTWTHELNIERVFVLVRNEAELPPLEDEPEDEDYLVADRELNLSELVEDEVLLDLPVKADGIAGGSESSSADLIGEPGDVERKHPFAALAALKKQNH
ncbi:MAG: DUF177 domain-containing protein [Burkholderiales bacterium]|nr:DUF177 domain-containing protein [Burkholderiales bacterium]